MANQLTMEKVHAIQHLHSFRWSQRRIAAEVGIDQGAVGRHLRASSAGPNAAIAPAGSRRKNGPPKPPPAT